MTMTPEVLEIREEIKKAENTLDWVTVSNKIMNGVADEATRKTLYKEMKAYIKRTKTNIDDSSLDFSNERAIEDFLKNKEITIGYVLAYCRKKAHMGEAIMGKQFGLSITSVRAVEKADYKNGINLPSYEVLTKYASYCEINQKTLREFLMHTPIAAINYWDKMWQNTNTIKVGTMLKNIRLSKNMKATEVSDKLGMQQPNYTRIENGQYASTKKMLEILEVLDETPELFLQKLCQYTDIQIESK